MLPPTRPDRKVTQMGKEEEARQATFQHSSLKKISMYDIYGEKVIMKEENEEFGSVSAESSMEDSEDSNISSFCSSEVAEDAFSPPSCPPPRSPSTSSSSSSSSSNGPLYELSELMAQLPIKRGLSRYYQGKSQSYTSLASVKSIEDLAKKGNYTYMSHYKIRKMKSCKSYGWELDGQHNNNRCFSPKATISKKAPSSSRGCVLSSLGRRSTAALAIAVNVPSPHKSSSDMQ